MGNANKETASTDRAEFFRRHSTTDDANVPIENKSRQVQFKALIYYFHIEVLPAFLRHAFGALDNAKKCKCVIEMLQRAFGEAQSRR